jgi:hypothetical protein
MRPNPTGPFSNDPEPPPDNPDSGTGAKAPGTLGSKVTPPGAKALSDPPEVEVPDPDPKPKSGLKSGVDPKAKS